MAQLYCACLLRLAVLLSVRGLPGATVQAVCAPLAVGLMATSHMCLQGFVYLKFNNLQSAAAAQRALHGRWFAGRQIVADFQFTPVYNNFFKA